MKPYFKIFILLFLIAPICANAQSSYLIRGGKEDILLDRLEIKLRPKQLLQNTKPFSRKLIVQALEPLDSLYNITDKKTKSLSEVDKYNVQRFLMNNSEWSKPKEIYRSEKPIWKFFYEQRGDMINMQNKDFILIANPILNYQMGSKAGNEKSTFVNQRGIVTKGIIGGKIGIQFYFTENQERQPVYIQEINKKFTSVPGAGYIKDFKVGGNDYFDIRSSVNWKVAKFMDMQLGYDRNFIGNGYRSLFLSDFATNYSFLKVSTRFGKFTYQNLFTEMVSQHVRKSDYLFPRKYVRFSHLQYNATKWLNIGLFEALVIGKNDALSASLFNPIIFTNINSNNATGVQDKSYKGFDAKLNLAKKFQLYTQLLVDNLQTQELKNNWWGNKFSYQLGVKYIDAFKIKNLDVQIETNVVRPFMYTSADTVTNYTHYNQPIAHPLGANFKEYIAIVRYQPLKQLYIESKVIFYNQGLDSSILTINQNYGNNIFTNSNTRPFDNNWTIGTGDYTTCNIFSFTTSYELKENLFIDFNYLNRSITKNTTGKKNTSLISLGVRWNIGRRELLY